MSRDSQVNTSIPRTMTLEALRYLGRMARAVPRNGTIVELGSFYGSATWVLSKNADPSVTIYSIDTWEPQPWIPRRLPDALPFSVESFKQYTSDCSNIVPIQGASPSVVADWDRPIDMFIGDIASSDPVFSENLNYFLPHMKDKGIICGSDFSAKSPDVVKAVNNLAYGWGVRAEVCGHLWSIMTNGTSTIADHIGEWDDHDLTIVVTDSSGAVHNGSPHMWVGPVHSNHALSSIMVERKSSNSKIEGMLQARLRDGTETDWIPFGEMIEFGSTITNMRFVILNGRKTNTAINYQLCELDPISLKTCNSKVARNGEWVKKEARTLVCGVKAVVESLEDNFEAPQLRGLNSKLAV